MGVCCFSFWMYISKVPFMGCNFDCWMCSRFLEPWGTWDSWGFQHAYSRKYYTRQKAGTWPHIPQSLLIERSRDETTPNISYPQSLNDDWPLGPSPPISFTTRCDSYFKEARGLSQGGEDPDQGSRHCGQVIYPSSMTFEPGHAPGPVGNKFRGRRGRMKPG